MSEGKINTGLVYVGVWAKKMRRIGLAIAKQNNLNTEEVIRKINETNVQIFQKLSQTNVTLEDVVRIEVEYKIENNEFEIIGQPKIVVYKKMVEL